MNYLGSNITLIFQMWVVNSKSCKAMASLIGYQTPNAYNPLHDRLTNHFNIIVQLC